ncbi:MAG TPA: RsmB/NOP family class I SAM-dependent RNA methyltransferase [Caulobacteraceae bacterium]|nr:RsmB/NOP family class I SAM-dependent RNA methyltransferase [Caulobacteraceae bacterium]
MNDQTAPQSPDSGLLARTAALALISAALERRSGLDEALNDPRFTRLSTQDRAFARAVAMAALRNLGRIDRMLDARLHKPPPDAVIELLRLGLAQMLALDVPDFAAVATTVTMAERNEATRPFKGLINAVLRGIARERPQTPPEANLPDWLWQRWRGFYGDDTARAIANAATDEPPTDLTPRDDASDELVASLDAERLAGGSLRTRRHGELPAWPGFAEGDWWVQDAAAAIPARLLNVGESETACDLCAAPGGKTLQLASAGANVVAVDRSAQRLKRLHENLQRTRLAADVVVADAESWNDARTFDAVLLDAPCTSTGTFRRNPETLWSTRPADIAKLADVQHRLLDASAKRVKPGGRLVYCVCSLEREEGEAQAVAFLRRHPEFETLPAEPGEAGAPEAAATPEGWLRILPSQWPEIGGLDGFFAARFSRRG